MEAFGETSKYKAYKYSGEDWIAEIPAHWEVRKLKHLFREKKHTQNMALNCGSISFGEVVTKDDDKIPLSTKASYQEVLSGEFLINPLNLNYDLISLRIGLSKIDVVVSAGYIVLKEKIKISREYFNYLLHRYDVAYMKLLGSGVRQTISFNHIANSLLILPPETEQVTIANFLDQKTAQIDEAIAIKEKQIALLKERKQIIIQKAVTQGLDPNVPMKDSGVDWIGEIPEHWEMKKLKFISTYFKGFAFKSDDFSGVGVPIVKASNIKEHSVSNIQSFIAKDNQRREFERFRLSTGDVVVSTVGSKPEITNSAVGQLCSVNSEYNESYLNQNTVCIRPSRKLDKRFLKYVFASKYVRNEFDRKALWIANQAYLEVDEILDILIAIPDFDEQSSISDYLDSQATKFSRTIDSQLQQIEKLKEYKTTLINSAVTGKIKVA